MAKSKKQWVSMTQEKLQAESSKSSCKYVGDKVIHCAEPIPDNDWVGETWGLYFSDYEEELLGLIEHDTDKYIKKHPQDKINPCIFEVEILTCERKEKAPEKPIAEPPSTKMKEKSPEIVKAPTPPIEEPLPAKVIEKPPKIVKAPTPPIEEPPPPKVIEKPPKIEKAPALPVKTPPLPKVKEISPEIIKAPTPPIARPPSPKVKEKSPEAVKVPTPEPPKPVTPPPPEIPKWLVDNALHPALPLATVSEVLVQVEEAKNNKWSWMKEDRGLTQKTKYRLSMYW